MYERDVSDVLELQRVVTQAIASQIRAKVTAQEQASVQPARATDPAAHEAYLKGQYDFNKRTEDGMWKSVDYFRRARLRGSRHGSSLRRSCGCLRHVGIPGVSRSQAR